MKAEIYNENCLDTIKQFKQKGIKINVIITSPPYNQHKQHIKDLESQIKDLKNQNKLLNNKNISLSIELNNTKKKMDDLQEKVYYILNEYEKAVNDVKEIKNEYKKIIHEAFEERKKFKKEMRRFKFKRFGFNNKINNIEIGG